MNLKPLVVYLVFVLSLLKLKLARDGLSNILSLSYKSSKFKKYLLIDQELLVVLLKYVK